MLIPSRYGSFILLYCIYLFPADRQGLYWAMWNIHPSLACLENSKTKTENLTNPKIKRFSYFEEEVTLVAFDKHAALKVRMLCSTSRGRWASRTFSEVMSFAGP